MNCAEAYVKFMCQWLLDNCLDDMEFMADKFDKTCIDRLRMVASTPFERVSYTEAVDWGIDLASEHERYVTTVFKFFLLEQQFLKPLVS